MLTQCPFVLFLSLVPSQAPINVLALNKTSPTKIIVRWNPIPDEFYIHGILRGYRVFYKAIATANKKLDDGVIQTRNVAVNSFTLAVVLENLSAFTRYEIEVLAFTIKGNGVRSNAVTAGIDLSFKRYCESPWRQWKKMPVRTAIPTEKHKVTSILEFDKSNKEVMKST